MLPREDDRRAACETVIERLVEDGGQRVLGWRDVPVDEHVPGPGAPADDAGHPPAADRRAATRRLRAPRCTAIRRRAERGLGDAVAFPSFSSRTMVLKGMLGAPQLPRFYKDLCDPRFASALAIVHSRFSTNTFPSWALAHPFRFVAHNGEINTLRGNVNWMRAREHALGEFAEVRPVIPPGASDSASFDAVLELLVLAGRPLAHAVMMMVPEAWEGRDDLPEDAARVLRLPREAHGAVGRAGVDHVLRRADPRREAGPQRAAARPLGCRPTTAGSCSRPRRARCRWSPRGWSGAGG